MPKRTHPPKEQPCQMLSPRFVIMSCWSFEEAPSQKQYRITSLSIGGQSREKLTSGQHDCMVQNDQRLWCTKWTIRGVSIHDVQEMGIRVRETPLWTLPVWHARYRTKGWRMESLWLGNKGPRWWLGLIIALNAGAQRTERVLCQFSYDPPSSA